jgi:hypothetical protein
VDDELVSPDEESGEVGGDEDESEEEDTPPVASFDSPSPTHDPLLDLPPERRAALLALDQTIMADEAKRAAVFGILSGDSDAPKAPPAPTLPEHIDPESFEATLWHETQELRQTVAQLAAQSRAVQEQTIQQRAVAAADEAGRRFSAKYSEQLSETDVLEIAQYAGQSGVMANFSNTKEARENPVVAFEQALEHTLWTNEAFRQRVLGTSGPQAQPGDAPEAQARKRKLHAVSGAAGPTAGPTPGRSPLENGADGKLTERSRQDLVKEAANMLRRTSEGTL